MKRIYATIFLVSCSALALEISLTRLFSIYLSYHFAFMVISIAMLGIGTAGTVLSLYPQLKRTSNLGAYAAFAGISMLIGYAISNRISFDPIKLSWNTFEIFYLAIYYIALSIPFFFVGLVISTAFSLWSERSGTIYCSDLLGAGCGSLIVIGLLSLASPEYAILAASTLCLVASFLSARTLIRIGIVLLIVLNIAFLFIHPSFINIRLSPYKNLSLALKYPGAQHLDTYYNSFSRIDTLKSPAVRFAPGLSLTYLDPLPQQIGMSIDGSEMTAVTNTSDKEALEFLQFLPSALVYELKKGKNTQALVLEPKGGLQALTAKFYGVEKLDKVESNPLVTKIVRDKLGTFSGDIYKDDTWTGLGRSWLRKRKAEPGFDIIDLSTTGTWVGGTFGIAEDYRLTVEAFSEYLRALRDDGFISISLYLLPPPRIELRMLTTAIAALEQMNVENTPRHIAAIRSWDSITIVVKKTPLDKNEIKRIREFSQEKRFDLVHYPGMNEEEANRYVKLTTNEYFKNFQQLLNSQTRSSFIKTYLFNIKPVHDDDPFSNYYLKFKNLGKIYDAMGQKWQYFIEEGYLLPAIFIQVVILCLILILLPVFSKTPKQGKPLIYFAMLGLGFMFVEITLIQKSILALENPSYALAIVLTAILISSGLGSIVSSRISKLTKPYSLLILAVLIGIYSFAFPTWIDIISPHTMSLKVPAVFASLIPIGFFMGIPFPMGMNLLGRVNPAQIPWAWAINGCLSVLAPILAIMTAMMVGFKIVLWCGAGAYLIAFSSFLLYLTHHRYKSHSS